MFVAYDAVFVPRSEASNLGSKRGSTSFLR
jgi:hypothetical protein